LTQIDIYGIISSLTKFEKFHNILESKGDPIDSKSR
jgi:hypothetical protein